MTAEEFKKLQKTELEILKEFDRVCREKHLKYSLYAGTLIGAVRHQGFIPWDDDIDVCMPRKDYDQFISIWNDTASEQYLIQNHKLAEGFRQSFTKIFKNHTTLLYSENPTSGIHHGINIDIFPVDRLPNGVLQRILFFTRCMRYQLYIREYVPQKSNWAVRLCCKMILFFQSKAKRNARIDKLLGFISKADDDTDCPLILIETMRTLKRIYPADLFDNLIEMSFEDGKFMVFENFHDKLRIDFGDYMTLPPLEEREPPHKAYLLDFTRNYEELKI